METPIDNSFEQAMQEPKRPQFLTVLCVLSYIWSGICILCLLLALAFSGLIFEACEKVMNGEGDIQMNEMQIQGMDKMIEMGQGAFAAVMGAYLVACIISLLGVIKMWKLQKMGFYIYTVINGLALIYGIYEGSYFGGVISLAFIIMYGVNLKHMNK